MTTARDMPDIRPNDTSHRQNIPTNGEHVGMATIAQFYAFAERCIDWANTTRSMQERAVYTQMGLQWLAAGARLQTFLQLKKSQDAKLAFEMEGKRT
jgi:hypothetical protein